MAPSPVKFFVLLLATCVLGWVVFIFSSRLLAWILSRIMGASVGFRVAGCNCLRDVNVKFRKGAVDSVSVGEIKLSFRKSLVKLGVGFFSRDPKLQLLVCDFEVVMRASESNKKGVELDKPRRSQSARSKGKWMVVANMARFISVSITDLIVKVSTASIEVKDLKMDISKDGGSAPTLFVKLNLQPIFVHMIESRLSGDQSLMFGQENILPSGPACLTSFEKNSVPFICERLSILSEFVHARRVGVVMTNMDIQSGEVIVNLDDNLFDRGNANERKRPSAENVVLKKSIKKSKSTDALKKNVALIPEKVSFDLPKLDVRFVHHGYGLSVENNVMGIHLKCCKSNLHEDSGEVISHFDVHMDFSEIYLLRENDRSVLKILKLAIVSSVDIPLQLMASIRAEFDVKLGGTQFNIILCKLKPWMQLVMTKNKSLVLREENTTIHEQSQDLEQSKTDMKAFMWTCTLSAPEMTIVLCGFNESPLYHCCSQSSHLFVNNIATKGIAVHGELGELHLHMADEYQECLQESLFGIEMNSGSLIHIARVSVDWGYKEIDVPEALDDVNRWKLGFAIDVSGMSTYLSFQRIESVINAFLSIKALLKSISPSRKRTTQQRGGLLTKARKGVRIWQLNFERCSVNFFGDVGVENAVVMDPKKVNYGTQGGQIMISVSADGTPRRAYITSTLGDSSSRLNCSISLEIFHFSGCINRDKQSMQMDIERTKCVYQECFEACKSDTKVTLFDMQNARFVSRSGGNNDNTACSLFSATDIGVRWEPDVHLFMFELFLRLKSLWLKHKNREEFNVAKLEVAEFETDINSVQSGKHRRKDPVFAVDVEKLRLSAELADGVEIMILVESIFSENARIGLLLEGLILRFNEARIFQSSRMQISRVPCVSVSNSSADAKIPAVIAWDWVIRGLDVHICMPYRLQLRAIDDAIEDTLRALKLICAAKSSLINLSKKESSTKVKNKSANVGCIKFSIRKLTADIEEEPLQGWLDEHYRLMKKEQCELDVRLKYLDDMISKAATSDLSEGLSENKIYYNGTEIDVNDKSAIKGLQEELHKQAFRSYYRACKQLVSSNGSGSYNGSFQAGFKQSTSRTSLFLVNATELDLKFTNIEGGDGGMIEFIRKHDPVCAENEVPFSRLYGQNISLSASSLSVQLRDYSFPVFSAMSGKCDGCVVLAQQATLFQPQIQQDVFVGKRQKVRVWRSASGTTPALKTYSILPLVFEKAEISFGVGYEPVLADISYAFTIALRRANLGTRGGPDALTTLNQPKKEKNLPWWDDMRYYIHGKNSLSMKESKWYLLATTDPYEKCDMVQFHSDYMDIQQSDGRIYLFAKKFKILVSSVENLMKNCTLKLPVCPPEPFIETPSFCIEVDMDWECDSGNPLDHYLHTFPLERKPRERVLDPFRSTSLSLKFNFSLRPSFPHGVETPENDIIDVTVVCLSGDKSEQMAESDPTMRFGAHDLAWVFKWWNMYYIPPHKLRSFSRWPRYRIPRVARSGNLSLDKVMTELMLRVDSMPACIVHMPFEKDDPAMGLTFKTTKLKYELCYSRGKQKYTFECKRDPLDLVYQGLDLHMLKSHLKKEKKSSVDHDSRGVKNGSHSTGSERVGGEKCTPGVSSDDGFLLSSDYFTIRKQAPKADPSRLLAWQDAGRRNLEMTYVLSEFENGSESDHTRSDMSDDDGFNVVIADNCQRVFVYGLKLLWTLRNRDAVWAWVGGISKAFEPSKPSPSRQYAQRKLAEVQELDLAEVHLEETSKPPAFIHGTGASPQHGESLEAHSSPSASYKMDLTSGLNVKHGAFDNPEEDGTRHFMVNVIQPQFNLHSEDANGRFLLAAASGRVLARSFHSVLQVGYEMIEQALGAGDVHIRESQPEMTWKRVELSVMLEHVQAHVAPTDVDPGAGVQWLPKILRSSPKVKRTGALLERVFLPCTMYFRYTRHKGGTPELKVKPLKELSFNSPNITATMTSRQFQVMVDVLTNLLFARLPKPRKNSLSYASDDDEDVSEEADEVVPDGVEEVELARITLEQAERERKLLLDDIRTLSSACGSPGQLNLLPEKRGELWMLTRGKSTLVQELRKEIVSKKKSRQKASASLRTALQRAAHSRLMEKEKNKSPSCAMRISLRIDKVMWCMLADGKPFAEAEINNMIYDFDRDYKDIGMAQFTTKYFVVRNCLPNAKCDMLLSAWNPPPEWGKNVMLRVDATQGAPREGGSPLEVFKVEIYPLKIHLTETAYRMMWDYFFPEEEQDSLRRQELWRVSTTASVRAGLRRMKKTTVTETASTSTGNSRSVKDTDSLHMPGLASSSGIAAQCSSQADSSQGSKFQNLKANMVCGSNSELRRTSSFDRTWEETVAESVPNELVLSTMSSTRSGPLNSASETQLVVNEEASKGKAKDSKLLRAGRSSNEEKKVVKSQEEKRSRTRKMMVFHDIKISQVELLVTYEGSRFAVSELKLLMDTFHRVEFTGTWTKLFSRVKKHIIWSVLKSVTGMQGKKFKDKTHSQRESIGPSVPDSDLNFSDSDGGHAGKDPFPGSWLKRSSDGAGDGFVTSIKGLFNSQSRRAKAFVRRTMRGEADNEFHGEWSESDVEVPPFAKQLTITKRLIRRHTKKFRSKGQKGLPAQPRDSVRTSPRDTSPYQSDSSNESSSYEDFHD